MSGNFTDVKEMLEISAKIRELSRGKYCEKIAPKTFIKNCINGLFIDSPLYANCFMLFIAECCLLIF